VDKPLAKGRYCIERLLGELRVEAPFALADAVERAVELARRRADAKRVDQAILARAFRGKL